MKTATKIDVLRQLVAIDSVNGNELAVANYLKKLFDAAEIQCDVFPAGIDRANLVAEIGSGSPVLAVSGHMDVVAAERRDWHSDPFTLTTDGDRLIGRGACDMKSGLAALVIAMIELKAAGTPLKGTVRLLATFGEEFAEKGAAALTAAGYMRDVTALMIAEPSGYRICYGQAGSIDITLTAKGRAAHSSMPNLGSNAVDQLLSVLYQIKQRVAVVTAGAYNQTLNTDTLFNIDVFHGGEQVNTIPDLAQAQVNMRTIPEVSNADLIQVFTDTIDEFNRQHQSHIKFQIEMSLAPIVGDPHSKMINLIQKIALPYYQQAQFSPKEAAQNDQLAAALGLPANRQVIPTMGAAGGTDARRFLVDHPIGADYSVFGPGNLTAHQGDEYVSQAMYLDFINIYEALFPAYLAAK